MDRRNINEHQQPLVSGFIRHAQAGEFHLLPRRVRAGNAHLGRPMAFVKKVWQHSTKGRLTVEEPHPSDAKRVIAGLAQSFNPSRGIVHERGRVGCLATGKLRRKETWMRPRSNRRRQKPRKKRVMGRVGETARCMSFLPRMPWQN